ncbi:hypothetical protein IFT80_21225 [Pseudomonas sp. CFBP 8771]|uniref:hypothetical protein n=1 Tax=Pseudomonas sp. CFBP 8771 TaxID=2775285 RepID=UPI00177B852E|nr:hypothetical protein [Pseudomonas sp. CFBP 8771]MBD8605163.1 hypothetical protein [Pseudomonas sp. CFBP 8771]
MTSDFTEEAMRQALFGTPALAPQITALLPTEPVPEIMFVKPRALAAEKKMAKAFTPRLRVALRVGNVFEGKTFELIHEADTLSKLLAEQDAVKAAKKKYRYVEIVLVKSM